MESTISIGATGAIGRAKTTLAVARAIVSGRLIKDFIH